MDESKQRPAEDTTAETEAANTTAPVKVSVVMPIYNAKEYLLPALRGVQQQTLSDIEIICVDDGSTDGCLKALKELQKKDTRIRILTESNAGPAIARNKGLARASGEYVMFLDADDLFDPKMLEILYREAKCKELDIAVCGYDLYRHLIGRFTDRNATVAPQAWLSGGVLSKSHCPETIFQITDGYIWNKLFSRKFLEEKGLRFMEDIRIFEDSLFVSMALSLAERVGRVGDILIHQRVYRSQARQKLYRKYYMNVPAAAVCLKEFLMRHGMYLPLSKSYANLSASQCYKMYRALGAEEEHAFFDYLHEHCEDLGWGENTPDAITDSDVSEFVANTEMYTYAQYSERKVRGRRLRLDKFIFFRRRLKRKEKVRSFFAKVFSFGRKKEKKK